MEIDCIFAEQLYAFRYEGEEENELDRLLELWSDVHYLQGFAKENNIFGNDEINTFVNEVLKNAEEIDDFIEEIQETGEAYELYFEALQLTEQKLLARQKGKIRRNILRIYAIKIDDNCFVITGGAIKMSQAMQEHPDTAKELEKLNQAKYFFENSGVFDFESFYELITSEL